MPEKVDSHADPAGLADWCQLHEKVALLPDRERAAFELLYYQGLSQAEASVILKASVRTIQRRWHDSLLALHTLLKGEWPAL